MCQQNVVAPRCTATFPRTRFFAYAEYHEAGSALTIQPPVSAPNKAEKRGGRATGDSDRTDAKNARATTIYHLKNRSVVLQRQSEAQQFGPFHDGEHAKTDICTKPDKGKSGKPVQTFDKAGRHFVPIPDNHAQKQ